MVTLHGSGPGGDKQQAALNKCIWNHDY